MPDPSLSGPDQVGLSTKTRVQEPHVKDLRSKLVRDRSNTVAALLPFRVFLRIRFVDNVVGVSSRQRFRHEYIQRSFVGRDNALWEMTDRCS